MMAGKKLDERAAYVRVHFKPTAGPDGESTTKEVLFHIQGGQLRDPMILVSSGLPRVSLSNKSVNLFVSGSTNSNFECSVVTHF